jgi:hypothetical protein
MYDTNPKLYRTQRPRFTFPFPLFFAAAAFAILGLLILMVEQARGADNGQWELTDPVVSKWFEQLKQPDNPHISCCGFADAYYADKTVTRNGVNYAIITDDRPDEPLQRRHIPIGTEIEIPNHKYKYDEGNPTGHTVIFLASNNAVYCFVVNGGV